MAMDLHVGAKEGLREVMTLSQFLKMPEIKPALEFIRGRVVQKVSPNLHHSLMQLRLPNRINDHSEPGDLGLALPELRCSFAGESYVPDVSYFSTGRLPVDEKGQYLENVLTPPDLSIEILSPGQTVKRLSARLTRCLQKGVRLGWLIQPRKRRAFDFRPGHPPRELHLGESLDGGEVLPGFTLPLEKLFGWLACRSAR